MRFVATLRDLSWRQPSLSLSLQLLVLLGVWRFEGAPLVDVPLVFEELLFLLGFLPPPPLLLLLLLL